MKKNDIAGIKIDIELAGESALSMVLSLDGNILRRGNGSLPGPTMVMIDQEDDSVFRELLALIDDDRVFDSQGVYDQPDKQGRVIRYCVLFAAIDGEQAIFDFRVGEDDEDVPALLPFFDRFAVKAASLTEPAYQRLLSGDDASG